MRAIRILVAAVLTAAACVVAVPANSNAAPPPLTITCTPAPAQCTAIGQIGPLFGATRITPNGAAAIICLDATCSSGAILVIGPRILQAVAAVDNVIGTSLYLSGLSASFVAFTNTFQLTLAGSNGVVGLLLLTPGRTVCLALDHLQFSTTAC